jgi:glycosyltransferase involved in cell wall biosynthesis
VTKAITWFMADMDSEYNTSGHRINTPSKRLAKAGYLCYISHVRDIMAGPSPDLIKALDESSVVVIERLVVKETHKFIQDMCDKGKLVVCTFDDDYSLIPDSVSHNTWRGGSKARNGSGDILGEFRDGLRLVDKYITPSKLLCDDFKMYNQNSEYVPNYLDPDIWNVAPNKTPDVITIGYGGTSLHSRSWLDSGVIPALGKICKKYPRAQLMLTTPYPDVVKALNKFGVRFVTGNWVKFDDWPKQVAKFDIGLAPLDGKRYDAHRSNLKVLEYATAGIPWIATNDAPYQDVRGGILCENKSSAWERAVEEVLDDLKTSNHYAQEGYAWATEFNKNCESRYSEVLGL